LISGNSEPIPWISFSAQGMLNTPQYFMYILFGLEKVFVKERRFDHPNSSMILPLSPVEVFVMSQGIFNAGTCALWDVNEYTLIVMRYHFLPYAS
jgi:hypothetical protein